MSNNIHIEMNLRNLNSNNPDEDRQTLIQMIQGAVSDADSSGENGLDYLLEEARIYLTKLGIPEDNMSNDLYWAKLTEQLDKNMSDKEIIDYYIQNFYNPTVYSYYDETDYTVTYDNNGKAIAISYVGIN